MKLALTRTIFLCILATLLSGCGLGKTTDSPSELAPLAIKIYPPSREYDFNRDDPFILHATYKNRSTVDVTNTAQWRSSDESIATIDKGFFRTYDKPGKVTIEAIFGDLVDSVEITILDRPSVVGVIPRIGEFEALEKGQTLLVIPHEILSDGRLNRIEDEVLWESSDESIISIDDNGLLRAISYGTAYIKLTYGEFNGALELTVLPELIDFTLSQTTLEAIVGKPAMIGIKGTFADGSSGPVKNKLDWFAHNESQLVVDEYGVITPRKPGSGFKVSAKLGDITHELTVNARTSLRVSHTEVNTVTLFWENINAQQYKLYWSASPNIDPATADVVTIESTNTQLKAVENSSLLQFTHRGLNKGQQYFYRLGAVYADSGEVEPGEEIAAYLPLEYDLKPINIDDSIRFGNSFAQENAAIAISSGQLFISGGNITGPSSGLHTYDLQTLLKGSSFSAPVQLERMPEPRTGHVSCIIDKRLFVAGGRGGNQFSNIVDVYDFGTNQNTWHTPATPQKLASDVIYGGCAAVGRDVFIFGGVDKEGNLLDTVYRYDTNQNRLFIHSTTLPEPRSHMATYVINGIIYVSGGITPTGVTASTIAFDPETPTGWVKTEDLPYAVSGASIHISGANLYLIGGKDGDGNPINTIHKHDGNNWSFVTTHPSTNSHFYSAVDSGLIYLIGDFDDTSNDGEVVMYSLLEDQWYPRRSPGIYREQIASVQSGKYVYFLGGLETDNIPTGPHYERYDIENDSWETIVELSSTRYAAAAAEYNGKIYLTGGIDISPETKVLNRVDVFDPANMSWSSAANLPEPRQGHSMVSHRGKLYLVGGTHYAPDLEATDEELSAVASNTTSSAIYVYDDENDSWKIEGRINENVVYPKLAAHDHELIVIGGLYDNNLRPFNDSNKIQRYDLLRKSWANTFDNAGHVFATTVEYNDRLLVFGGKIHSTGSPRAEEYDFYNHRLKASSFITAYATKEGIAASYKGRIYYIGGITYFNTFLPTVAFF